ncbi:ATP-grasp domain-containing protein [Undibacterium oligocarboniphilum]|uniref:N5-carboxyaminoimidazole ribonucleotide synthase n=1 Tax=Undibacterium oligocarboniphilum TaxID=666702 RepID=A0A850QSU2_9BURK|nr:ATP-grasp domain-containing protein [Undibacterium oligocarboniphilum]MBC3871859.1 ATP-grasp domain-containing protein [Undibacterium oligocarboniphilum]NVO79434.1 ATP-grasp domain-containing protein [Undibacterium oligocarboniphilum]
MKVAVLGNGQLGTMLQQAGQRIGIDVHLLNTGAELLPPLDMPITAEREHWPVNRFTEALQRHPGWLNSAAFPVLSNRIRQKTLIDQLELPTAAWCAVSADTSLEALHQTLGPDIFLKRASGGYDGRGQQRLREGLISDFPTWADDAIAEQAIFFDTEVSIIGARSRDGQVVYYRLTENRHEDGVLTISLSQPSRFDAFQSKAEKMLRQVMQALDYVGVMAMECFIVDGQLLVNEIAPRVHNSGHWTQAGASICQFELHLRAVCGLPLPQPVQSGYGMMINLLGVPYDAIWLKHGAAQLHWYGKSLQPGRKMGHLNFYHPSAVQLSDWLVELEGLATFENSCKWAVSKLSADIAN